MGALKCPDVPHLLWRSDPREMYNVTGQKTKTGTLACWRRSRRVIQCTANSVAQNSLRN